MKIERSKLQILVMIVVSVLIVSVSGCTRSVRSTTKPSIAASLDSIGFTTFAIPKGDFFISCLALKEILGEKFPELEIKDALFFASDVRVVMATWRDGEEEFPLKARGVSFRDVLSTFAKIWDVTVLVNGNDILIVDHFDKERFPYEIVIGNRVP